MGSTGSSLSVSSHVREATVRYAAELGYGVTVIKDATADYSDEEMHAALNVNIPNYASAIVQVRKATGARTGHYARRKVYFRYNDGAALL